MKTNLSEACKGSGGALAALRKTSRLPLQASPTEHGVQVGWGRPARTPSAPATRTRRLPETRPPCPATTVSAIRFFTCAWTAAPRPQPWAAGQGQPAAEAAPWESSGDTEGAWSAGQDAGEPEVPPTQAASLLLRPVSRAWLWLYVVLVGLLVACGEMLTAG